MSLLIIFINYFLELSGTISFFEETYALLVVLDACGVSSENGVLP